MLFSKAIVLAVSMIIGSSSSVLSQQGGAVQPPKKSDLVKAYPLLVNARNSCINHQVILERYTVTIQLAPGSVLRELTALFNDLSSFESQLISPADPSSTNTGPSPGSDSLVSVKGESIIFVDIINSLMATVRAIEKMEFPEDSPERLELRNISGKTLEALTTCTDTLRVTFRGTIRDHVSQFSELAQMPDGFDKIAAFLTHIA